MHAIRVKGKRVAAGRTDCRVARLTNCSGRTRTPVDFVAEDAAGHRVGAAFARSLCPDLWLRRSW